MRRKIAVIAFVCGGAVLTVTAWAILHPSRDVYDQMCASAWHEMSSEQKQTKGREKRFTETCLATSYVVQCRDGYVASGEALEGLCARHNGEKTLIKFPDA